MKYNNSRVKYMKYSNLHYSWPQSVYRTAPELAYSPHRHLKVDK
jgi:hypothetical protein